MHSTTSGAGFLNVSVTVPWTRMPVTSRRTRRSRSGGGTSPPAVWRSSSPGRGAPAWTGGGGPPRGRSPSCARAGAITFQMSDRSTSHFMGDRTGRERAGLSGVGGAAGVMRCSSLVRRAEGSQARCQPDGRRSAGVRVRRAGGTRVAGGTLRVRESTTRGRSVREGGEAPLDGLGPHQGEPIGSGGGREHVGAGLQEARAGVGRAVQEPGGGAAPGHDGVPGGDLDLEADRQARVFVGEV